MTVDYLFIMEHLESAMRTINLDAQTEAVKQFVLSLSIDPGGSVLELNGRPLACVLPVPEGSEAAPDEAWTETKNARRCQLIDREIEGTLTTEEVQELHHLQQEMLRHRRRVAPLPLEDARALHQQLLARAQASSGPQA